MAEIILIQPPCGSWDEMSVRFPESLLAVAAVPVSKGVDVRLIDKRVTKTFEQDLASAVGPETVIIGMTAITGSQVKHAMETTRQVKEKYPHIPVCWGGVHATLVPEQTAEHPLIDYVVVGDGDLVFYELYQRLKEKRSVHDLRGILYKVDGQEIRSNAGQLEVTKSKSGKSYTFVRKNGSADIIKDLDQLPRIPYQLVDFDDYNVFHTGDGSRAATLNTSRGCPFRCRFCSDPVMNLGAWRGFSPKVILEKVDYLYREHNVKMVYFQDDYFPGSKKRFLEILNGLAHYKRDLMWSTLGVRSDIISKLDAEELDLLYASGCHSLEVGIETGSERILALLNKGESMAEMRLANEKLAKYDITVKYTLIVGFPEETEEDVMMTVAFAEELERVNPNAYCLIFNFLPIIGTPYYEDAIKQGLKEPQSLEEWCHMDFDGWMHKYGNWTSPERRNLLEAISLVSYFHNKNMAYKLSGAPLLRLAFAVYHPIARWRFKNRYFGFFIEPYLKDLVLNSKYILRNAMQRLRGLRKGSKPALP